MTSNLTVASVRHLMPRGILWACMLLSLLLSGCAIGPNANPRDPFEPFNRGVYQFNDAVDVAVLKPIATAYREVTPVPVRHGIGNFFANLDDAWSVVNNALQFKGQAAIESFFRFGVNTFIGLGGILDVATEMNIEKHTKDFGHTLGFWGVAPGPYLVLPLLGPSSVRDTVALPVDFKGDLVTHIEHVPTRNSASVLRVVDRRSELLKATTMLDEVALDKYTFTRDAYFQRRRSAIFDGNPPDEDSSEQLPPQKDMDQAPSGALSNTGSAENEKAKP